MFLILDIWKYMRVYGAVWLYMGVNMKVYMGVCGGMGGLRPGEEMGVRWVNGGGG